MNQEKILKIAKGLKKFTFDDILIISEIDEKELKIGLDSLVQSIKIDKLSEDSYILINNTRNYAKKIAKKKKRRTITFKKASERYLESQGIKSFGRSTMIYYESYLKNHILPYFSELKLKQITPEVLYEFIQLKSSKGIASKSINNYRTLIGSILEKAVNDGYLDYNPIHKVKKLEKLPQTKRFLSIEEVKKLLKTAKTYYPDFYPLLFMALSTDMSRCELLGLTWEKVDFASKKIKVEQILIRKEIVPHSRLNSIRDIVITDEQIQVLSDWKLACPIGSKNLVFPNSVGDLQDPDNMIKRHLKPLLEKVGLEDIRFKDLINQEIY